MEFDSNHSADDSALYLNQEAQIARISELVLAMQALQKNKPAAINDAITTLEGLSKEIRLLVGNNISSVINSYDNIRPETLEQKRALAKSLNDLLDGLGLRVKCPKTGRGASIQVKTRGLIEDEGIFRLQIPGDHVVTTSSVALPKMELRLRDMREKPRGTGSPGFSP